MLPCVRRRPPDLDILDPCRLAKPDVLLERRRSKRSTARDPAVDGSPAARAVSNGYLDSCADGSAIALDADQLQRDPVVSVPGVFEDTHRVAVGRRGAADLGDDVLVAVVVEIDERD